MQLFADVGEYSFANAALISARVSLISTRVSAHCQAILLRLDYRLYINGFVQDCSNSSVQLLQSCTKQSNYGQ